MPELKKYSKLSWKQRLDVLNAIIEKLTPLLNIDIVEGDKTEIKKSDNQTIIVVRKMD
tara:strand:- start:45 stop:218 length:174 start_codon:yes stop_codon:yes gene_type:complete